MECGSPFVWKQCHCCLSWITRLVSFERHWQPSSDVSDHRSKEIALLCYSDSFPEFLSFFLPTVEYVASQSESAVSEVLVWHLS